MVFHIAWKVKGEGPYMEDFNSTLSRHFLDGIGPIEKQNWGELVGSCVCASTIMNMTILIEELGRYTSFLKIIHFSSLIDVCI